MTGIKREAKVYNPPTVYASSTIEDPVSIKAFSPQYQCHPKMPQALVRFFRITESHSQNLFSLSLPLYSSSSNYLASSKTIFYESKVAPAILPSLPIVIVNVICLKTQLGCLWKHLINKRKTGSASSLLGNREWTAYKPYYHNCNSHQWFTN